VTVRGTQQTTGFEEHKCLFELRCTLNPVLCTARPKGRTRRGSDGIGGSTKFARSGSFKCAAGGKEARFSSTSHPAGCSYEEGMRHGRCRRRFRSGLTMSHSLPTLRRLFLAIKGVRCRGVGSPTHHRQLTLECVFRRALPIVLNPLRSGGVRDDFFVAIPSIYGHPKDRDPGPSFDIYREKTKARKKCARSHVPTRTKWRHTTVSWGEGELSTLSLGRFSSSFTFFN